MSKYKAVTWEQFASRCDGKFVTPDIGDCVGDCNEQKCPDWAALPDCLTASNMDGAEITGIVGDEMCLRKGDVVRLKLHQEDTTDEQV